ncbi:MAG: GrpB family protein [Halothermotrichaceae bacterium]
MEHIGSTSVPAIKAKPIIDIMVAVGNKELFLSALKLLLDLGYRFIGNGGRI